MTRVAGLLVVAIVASGCAAMRGVTGGLPSKKLIESVAARSYSPGHLAVGKAKDVDRNRASSNGLVHAPALTTYLNGIAAKLAAASPMRDVPVQVYVLATDNFDAFSTPDANVYLSVGVLREAASEDEVAAVLAHETSHIILGHHDSDVTEDMQARVFQVTALALAVHGAFNQKSGLGTKELGTHAKVALGEAAALKLNQFVVGPAWQRGQEQDADLLGSDLLMRAGYDPLAMASMLEKEKKCEEQQQRDTATLGDAFKQLGVSVGAGATSGLKIDQQKVDEGVQTGVSAAMGWLGRTHPDTAARQKRVEQYVAREYAGPAPARLEQAWYRMTKEPIYRQIRDNYAKATDAQGLLANDDVAGAAAKAQEAVRGETSDHAYPLTVLASVRKSQGKINQGADALHAGLGAREPAWVVYRDAGALLESVGDEKNAVAVLEQGYRRLAEPVTAVPFLLRAYRGAGKKEEETKLAARCATEHPKEAVRGLCSIDSGTEEKNTSTASTVGSSNSFLPTSIPWPHR